jgi:cellulose synthase/poly-beta-1,6-N-acetylglucosamine synthase-like glycosyltransferase
LIDVIFWMSAGLIVYVYAGYPLLLLLIRIAVGSRRVELGVHRPTVSVVISAYNEAEVIAPKLRNSLEIDYERAAIEILVVSDASSDTTDEIVRSFEAQGVKLLRMRERGGKTLGLNEAVRQATGEIVVFSDANAMYRRDALVKLVRNFADPSVGAVVGQSTYSAAASESERSESLYWRYETAIKRLESQIGSVVGGDGAIYAIRRSLYRPMSADALSDFVNPLQIVRSGFRCVHELEAQSWEKAAESFDKEFRRKVRIVNRAWRALLSMPQMLNPFRYGFFALELISHKLFRWLAPLFLIAALASNIVLAPGAALFASLLALQLLFYALAAAGYALRNQPNLPSMLAFPFYFCMVNLASALGIMEAWCGRTYTVWTTARTPVKRGSHEN